MYMQLWCCASQFSVSVCQAYSLYVPLCSFFRWSWSHWC